ncbi:alpha-L-fucosidase [Kaistia dalseonensis]|uniref:alpha-L-fucosidase n=1 Tax=Kaistia dalseonensis TaxID=410840 RepID=A0ABU0H0P5_9HYPH|nr:alpha-L-fucosidase [Kaistia dalseonensis]MCX5493320.1 alpha-L-fucosidase [Kaistia dalseonensis]MDQ0435877.1 alpha-L-fucosidase [Kaistia dalseonensis]
MNAPVPDSLFLPPEKKAWFLHDRFGMFIHWGLYSLAARHEWVKSREEISNVDYQKYFDHFDPDLYDAREWARRAKAAGMKYVVLTAKHHEGFCLWDSKVTDYKATNTPGGRDLVAEYVAAFRAEGLKIGFYYSLIDWHHPDFKADIFHPERNRDPDAFNKGRDVTRYAAYMRDQVRELLTGYGKIDVIWFDFSYPDRPYNGLAGKGREDWQSEELLRLVRELQPDIIVNNRLDLINATGELPDVTTPEQYVPQSWPVIHGEKATWEGCHTFSGSWGYYRDEESWKSPEQLVQILVDAVALGGNLLMNVGPTARGTFDHRAIAALDVYGEWLRLHGRAIYGAGASDYVAPKDCRLTQRGNRLYVHVFNWPFAHLHIPGLGGKVAYAQLLHDASEVRWIDPHAPVDSNVGVRIAADTLTLELPVKKPNVTVPVIELFLKD